MQWHDRTPCKYVGIHSGQNKVKPAIGGKRLNVNFKMGSNAPQAEYKCQISDRAYLYCTGHHAQGSNNGRAYLLNKKCYMDWSPT